MTDDVNKPTHITESEENAFSNITISPEQETVLLFKADLRKELEKVIRQEGLTSKKLAQILEIQESQVNDLRTENISKINIEKVVSYLFRLGQKVTVRSRKQRIKWFVSFNPYKENSR